MVSPVVTFLIPALNEAQGLYTLIPRLPPSSVVVVDDGSVDNTSQVSLEAGATVLRHKRNKGYDAALEAGLRYCFQNSRSLVVTLDADGQHDPFDAHRIAEALEAGVDLCAGVRPRFARFSEHWASIYFKRFHGITDPLCGMKGYNLEKLNIQDFAKLNLSVGTGLISLYTCGKLHVSEIGIAANSRTLGEPRFGVGFRPNFLILRALFNQVIRDVQSLAHVLRKDAGRM